MTTYGSDSKRDVPKNFFVVFFLFFFAYNCILAHIIDACNSCKYIGNGSVVYMVKRRATRLTVTQYIELYIASVLAKETEIFFLLDDLE